jgi:hypothetical protein
VYTYPLTFMGEFSRGGDMPDPHVTHPPADLSGRTRTVRSVCPAAGTRPRVLGMGLVAIISALAACQSHTPTPAPTGPPSLSAPTQSIDDDPGTAAIQTYRSMWQAYTAAGATANPGDARLSRYASDQALKTLQGLLAGYRVKGQILKGDVVMSPKVTPSASGAPAGSTTITDCLDSAKLLVYKTSGGRADVEPGGRQAVAAFVRKIGDTWKVTDLGVHGVGSC